jgi:oligopeptide/dipeptide ABC transporter ATP-binding protein
MVMYLGSVVERGPVEVLYANPYHPYTQALLNSEPSMEAGAKTLNTHTPIKGELPSPLNPPSGCRFRTRCPFAEERCAQSVPPEREVGAGHYVACLMYETGKEARVIS